LWATALVLGSGNTILWPELEGDADDIVSLLLKDCRGRG